MLYVGFGCCIMTILTKTLENATGWHEIWVTFGKFNKYIVRNQYVQYNLQLS